MFENFFPNISYFAIIIIFFTVLLGGFLRGFVGFGSNLLTVPIVAYFLTPIDAVVLVHVMDVPITIYLMKKTLKTCDLKTTGPMVAGLILTVPIGMLLLVIIDPNIMRVVIAVVILLLVILLASGLKIKGVISRKITILTGLIGGVVHGISGSGGPPFVTVLLSKNDDPTTTRGNIWLILNSLTIVGLIVLIYYDSISFIMLKFSLLLVPLYLIFTYVGILCFNKFGNEYFRKAALFLLDLIAIVTIITSL